MPLNTGIFSQHPSYEEAQCVLLGAPWEVSVSYGSGTVHGPQWIQQAGSQLDFFNPQTKKNISKQGIYFWLAESLKKKNDEIRPLALKLIQNQERVLQGCSLSSKEAKSFKQDPAESKQTHLDLQKVNQACEEMVQTVQEKTQKILDDQKLFGLIGGDHSVSEGALLEMGRRYKGNFGLLHLDAHADMRSAYQGFQHSHASVMYNVLHQEHSPCSIVQAGVRDLCEEEHQLISSHPRVHCFFDYEIKKQLFEGKTWKALVHSILKKLPNDIYISLDADALSWAYAPNTGCPVPGGLNFNHVSYLLDQIALSKKTIIGFDVVEVSRPQSSFFGEWDGNVGARLVYQLCELSLSSRCPS